MQNDRTASTEAPPIRDRPESVGFWAKAWPVLALGFITLLLVRACVLPAAPPSSPRFDAAAATGTANAKAMAALDAVNAGTPLDVALKALNMPVVNFAPASAEIPTDAKPVLAKAGTVIKALPGTARLEVGGHTDSSGSAEANMLLSRHRAQAVVNFMLANGVARERLVARGYGDLRPVASNVTEEGRFNNRRIEIKTLGR